MRIRRATSVWSCRAAAELSIKIHDGPPVNRHRPSVDVLFHSVAKHAGAIPVEVMLTGWATTAPPECLRCHRARAWTIAQIEASCVVFGMPRSHQYGWRERSDCEVSRGKPAMLAKIWCRTGKYVFDSGVLFYGG
ncbi:chemotaxis protein CheB [Shigella flexneri]